MAIKRVDPTARFKVISELDDALEHETPKELEALRKSNLPTRYEIYSESLDESKLKFKEGSTPTRFVIRCLKNAEVAEIQSKHVVVDTVTKKIEMGNPALAFLDYFKMGCLGIEDEVGKLEQVGPDDVGYGVTVGIGSVISLYTSLGKHLKK